MGCDPSQSYDEYMSESVGELLYGDEERDGLINDDFVHNTIEQDMKYHKETLKEVIKICEAKLEIQKEVIKPPKKEKKTRGPPQYKRITIEQYEEYKQLKNK
jgi:hypothetical protein